MSKHFTTNEMEPACNHLFIQVISIAPLQAHYYSEALPIQHGYCALVSRQSATDIL